MQLPDAAALERTNAVIEQVRQRIAAEPGVAHVIGVSGFSLLGGSTSNTGLLIATLKPWSERGSAQSVAAILADLARPLAAMPSAQVNAFNPPSIPGLGRTGGFEFELEALGDQSPQDLAAAMRALLVAANQDPRLFQVFSMLYNVSPAAIFGAMQAHLGAQYVSDFNLYSRVFQV